MLNYFTIPEIDIAFTIATTKLWSIQKFKIVGSVYVWMSVWECVYTCACMRVSVCICVCVCVCTWYHMQSNGNIFTKLNVVLVSKKDDANVASVQSNYSN